MQAEIGTTFSIVGLFKDNLCLQAVFKGQNGNKL